MAARGTEQLYNAALQARIDARRKAGKSTSKIDRNKSLTQMRSFEEIHAAVPAAPSRWSLPRYDDAMASFFAG